MLSKIFSLTTKAIQGSFSTGFDIQRIAINGDFIFTATKCGVIDIWLKERFTRVASIKMCCGGNAKFTCLASDMDGEMLLAGSSDGKIQVRAPGGVTLSQTYWKSTWASVHHHSFTPL